MGSEMCIRDRSRGLSAAADGTRRDASDGGRRAMWAGRAAARRRTDQPAHNLGALRTGPAAAAMPRRAARCAAVASANAVEIGTGARRAGTRALKADVAPHAHGRRGRPRAAERSGALRAAALPLVAVVGGRARAAARAALLARRQAGEAILQPTFDRVRRRRRRRCERNQPGENTRPPHGCGGQHSRQGRDRPYSFKRKAFVDENH